MPTRPNPRVFEYGKHWLVKRADSPNFYIYWYQSGGRRVRRKSTDTGDIEQAKAALVDFARRRTPAAQKSTEDILLLDALNDYVGPIIKRSVRQPPEQSALANWAMFIDEFGLESIADLTLPLQDDFIQWRLERIQSKGHPGSSSTIARELRVMRSAIRYAWKTGHISHVPYVRSVPESPPRSRFLFADEVHRLLEHCHVPHLRTFVLIALHTVQRPGAVLGLRKEQVNLDSGHIDFLPPGELPTRKRKPIVRISSVLRPVLENAIRESESGYLVDRHGGPVWNVRKSFKSACDRAGLEDVTPNTLRHTGATLLLASGVPIREVSSMLGHTVQRTTEMYGKHHPEFQRGATRALDRLFNPDAPSGMRASCVPNEFVRGAQRPLETAD